MHWYWQNVGKDNYYKLFFHYFSTVLWPLIDVRILVPFQKDRSSDIKNDNRPMIFHDWNLLIFTGPILTLPEPTPLQTFHIYMDSLQKCWNLRPVNFFFFFFFQAIGPKICAHPEEFQCHNSECIPRDWVSDFGPPDCKDGSDEIGRHHKANFKNMFVCRFRIFRLGW